MNETFEVMSTVFNQGYTVEAERACLLEFEEPRIVLQ
jgi:hypothetical protein